MSGFSEHKVMLCLDTDLYLAFIKLQADKGLGRAYAGLLPYVEGLYRLGYISQAVYDVHVKRYSEPLKRNEEKEPCPPLEDRKRKEVLDQANKAVKGMIEQFSFHNENSHWLMSAKKYAERFKELEFARTLLTMIEKAVTVPTVKEGFENE